MTCRKNRLHYVICYTICLCVIAVSFLFPLLVIFLHYPVYVSSKGDQIMMEKQKPYILYNQRPENLPHFCRGFRVLLLLDGAHDGIITQATTSRERPIYANHTSTYSFTEDIDLQGPKLRNLSYFLPSSSRVDVTSCGQRLRGEEATLTIPIFSDHGKMKRWMNSKDQDPESPDVFLYAQFPPCPSVTTVSFNTTGFLDQRWYFLLGVGRQNDEDVFSASLDLQFTKRQLEIQNPIGNCTAYTDTYCELDAPTGNDVYLVLQHSINSTYAYRSWTRVVCYRYDPYLSVMYFLVLPFGMSICSLLLYCILVSLGYCPPDEESSDREPDLPGVMYCDAGTWTYVDSHRESDEHSSQPNILPPEYDRALHFPNDPTDHSLVENFSPEINQDDSFLANILNEHYDRPTEDRMVTDVDNPPDYDSLSRFDGQSEQGRITVEPPPGYDTVLEVNRIDVSSRESDSPPAYDTVPVRHPPNQLPDVD